jgi:hypothetical protein
LHPEHVGPCQRADFHIFRCDAAINPAHTAWKAGRNL